MRKNYKFKILVSFFLVLLVGVGLIKLFPSVLPGKFLQNDRFSVAVSGPKNFVVSLSTTGKDAVLVFFPNNLNIPAVAHGYGQYPISKIYQVGELDFRGGEVYSDSVSQYLGIPIDGYVHSQRNFVSLKQYFFSPDFIFQKNSNLRFWDRLRFAQTIGGLRFDKINQVDLAKFADKIVLTDGSMAVSADPESLDNTLTNLFHENSISRERLRVSILNATDVAGLGEKAARILGNIGVTVVDVGSEDSFRKKCLVQTSEKLKVSLTAKRITDIFHCDFAKLEIGGKSDLTVIVGWNFADKLVK